jgi:secreted trypsin-like serine protease
MSVALVQPAGAILEGTDDTANQFESVGMLQAQVDVDEWAAFCSGTLVAPDVVLTAAHCTDFFTAPVGEEGFGPDDLRVSFDVAPDESSTYYVADHIVVHPDWLTAPPCLGNSKHLCLASPAEDIALVFLQETVAGVTPSPIAGPGYLDELDVTSETFTVVGYGTDDFIKGSALSPNQVTVFDGVRSYREITAINTHDAFPDRFIKVTAGVCFGDSGGPMLHDGTIVALNTWTFSLRCTGPNLEYRTDSPIAQAFLDANL